MSTYPNTDTNNAIVEINVDASKDETVNINGQPKVRLRKFELYLIMIGLSIGVFLAALDQTIVTTALPAIASEFGALDQITWVATAYLLTSYTLIIARAIAGIGGGGIVSLVMVIISDIVPLQESGKYQGIIGAVFSISSVMGPLLGGITWSFYIHLPLGTVTIGAVIFLLRLPHSKGSLLQKLKRIDYAGIIVVVGATVALLLSINWGGSKYPWTSPIIIILFIVGQAGVALFSLIETKFSVEPIAPRHLFKNLNIVGCFATNYFQGMAFFALVYYIPLYFQVVEGDSATESGLKLIPYVTGVVIASIFTGQLISRTNFLAYRTISAMGAALIAVGAGLMVMWDEDTGKAAQIGYMLIAGLGVGSIMHTTLLCALEIVEDKDIATVTTLLMFLRLIGAVFGVSTVGTVFSNVLSRYLANASISPEYIAAVKQSATIVNQLPEEIRSPIIIAYVGALRASFITILVLGVSCFISTIFMGNHRPKIGKSNKKVFV
ncbi:major facilitator superfamily domain-containing protein [Glomus cerebriforme]|uniref:Major facilitator superfamily domain-containing protein n=1 Tax=Glomus cerebriforme TaxID=658196 RepID=A0A397SU06_9GLOM|nr:major facilitator superfamily domain-containing protein [Glomus cerebriforme]